MRCGLRSCVRPVCCGPRPLAQMGSAIHAQTEKRPCWPPPYTGFVDRRTDRSASFLSSPATGADERQAAAAGCGRYACPLVIIAHTMRAVLLAKATAASLRGLRLSRFKSHGEGAGRRVV